MKHEWKIKEKKCTDVEQGLQKEDKNVEQKYVIQIIHTTFKRWRAVAIFTLATLLLGLSWYTLYSYNSSQNMSIIAESSLTSESQFESQKSNLNVETLGQLIDEPPIVLNKFLINEYKLTPFTRKYANSNTQSEVENDNTMREAKTSQLPLLENSEVGERFSEMCKNSIESNDKRYIQELKKEVSSLKLLPLLIADEIANTHSTINTNSDNVTPADNVEDIPIEPLSEYPQKISATYSEKSSVESGMVKHGIPPGDFDEPGFESSSDVKSFPAGILSVGHNIPETYSGKSSVESKIAEYPCGDVDENFAEIRRLIKKLQDAEYLFDFDKNFDEILCLIKKLQDIAECPFGDVDENFAEIRFIKKLQDAKDEKVSYLSKVFDLLMNYDRSDESSSESFFKSSQLEEKNAHDNMRLSSSSSPFDWLNVPHKMADANAHTSTDAKSNNIISADDVESFPTEPPSDLDRSLDSMEYLDVTSRLIETLHMTNILLKKVPGFMKVVKDGTDYVVYIYINNCTISVTNIVNMTLCPLLNKHTADECFPTDSFSDIWQIVCLLNNNVAHSTINTNSNDITPADDVKGIPTELLSEYPQKSIFNVSPSPRHHINSHMKDDYNSDDDEYYDYEDYMIKV